MSDVRGRVLIIDDEPQVVDVLTAYFSEAGRYEVMTAHQGADAVMIADFRRPDAVLLDISMPGMDGIAVLRALRATDSSVPVVMVTANGDEKVAKDALTIGAFDYVAKPFNFDVLDRIVVAAVTAGAARDWSPFGLKRTTHPAVAREADQVRARVPAGTREERRWFTPRTGVAL
jgi:DNA-binding response OmpR family regulator